MSPRVLRLLLGLAVSAMLGPSIAAGQAKRPFSIADDIGLTNIVLQDPRGFSAVSFSPDGQTFAAMTTRGLIKENLLEGSLWMWRTRDVRAFLNRHGHVPLPAPLQVARVTAPTSPVIIAPRWRNDGSGLLFLGTAKNGHGQVFEADVNGKGAKALTPDNQDAVDFDVVGQTFVYTVKSEELLHGPQLLEHSGPTFRTGQELVNLVFPLNRYPERARLESNLCEIWAVVGGRRFRVEDRRTHKPVQIFEWNRGYDPDGVFRLSPDGRSLATIRAVDSVPGMWGEYKDKPGVVSRPVAAGRQSFHTFNDLQYVSTYVTIDLRTGTVAPLLDAPEGHFRGWYGARAPRWSKDGKALLLPSSFLPLTSADSTTRSQRLERPCIALVDRMTHRGECVMVRKPGDEFVASFDSANAATVVLHGYTATLRMRRANTGTWERVDSVATSSTQRTGGIAVQLKQSLNERPVLVATDTMTGASGVLWDPNPQLDGIELGRASVLRWKDPSGHEWVAGLVEPPDFTPGKRYPLVIQTHGFNEQVFLTHGGLSTASAARELAAHGIVVLQMPDHLAGVVSTPQEAIRHVTGFESAIARLAADSVIDPDRVGLVGFSRTCYYVLHALTASRAHFAAASITDGVTYGYWDYLGAVGHGSFPDDDQVIGAPPFGAGLKTWFERSPLFNMDKVEAPLLVVAAGEQGLFWQWGEYAALRALQKPVELLDLGADNYEHVVTNPARRLASMMSTVDWFRFWLKGEEDPDPAKAAQYARWRELRKLKEGPPRAEGAVPRASK